jgi:hypothetical protein
VIFFGGNNVRSFRKIKCVVVPRAKTGVPFRGWLNEICIMLIQTAGTLPPLDTGTHIKREDNMADISTKGMR